LTQLIAFGVLVWTLVETGLGWRALGCWFLAVVLMLYSAARQLRRRVRNSPWILSEKPGGGGTD